MFLIYRTINNLSPELLVVCFKENKNSYSLRSIDSPVTEVM